MVQYPMADAGGMMRPGNRVDWSNEVMPPQGGTYRGGQNAMGMPNGAQSGMMGSMTGSSMMQPQPRLEMRNTVSDETVEAPLTVEEAHLGSLKAMLQRNRGNYMVATFLIGTQSTVSFEGILYEVGNDFVTIYQEGRDRYIVVDMYSLKYVEFYDTRGRAMCQAMLQESGSWQMV